MFQVLELEVFASKPFFIFYMDSGDLAQVIVLERQALYQASNVTRLIY